MAKGKMTLVIERSTVRELLEAHVAATVVGKHELKEFQIHGNGNITMTLVPAQAETPLLNTREDDDTLRIANDAGH